MHAHKRMDIDTCKLIKDRAHPHPYPHPYTHALTPLPVSPANAALAVELQGQACVQQGVMQEGGRGRLFLLQRQDRRLHRGNARVQPQHIAGGGGRGRGRLGTVRLYQR